MCFSCVKFSVSYEYFSKTRSKISSISSGSVCLHLMTSVLLLNTDKKKKEREREREDSSKGQQCDLWPHLRDSGDACCTDERCSTCDCGDLQNQSAAV